MSLILLYLRHWLWKATRFCNNGEADIFPRETPLRRLRSVEEVNLFGKQGARPKEICKIQISTIELLERKDAGR